MDTSDPDITFNEKGVCNHCSDALSSMKDVWFRGEKGDLKFSKTIEVIKEEGKNKQYDCILGLSGGVDSSYLCLKAYEFGLRPLIVHVDAGWNSELAVQNIEALVEYTGFDLHTVVVDWPSMRELHRCFLKAGVPNQDIPQDHAFFAALYKFSMKNKISWLVHGNNFATECILPSSWGYSAMDSVHIKAIARQFGEKSIRKFPLMSNFKNNLYFPFVGNMRNAYLLNFMSYSKDMAIKELEAVGWKYYGGKHFESRFTKFFQSYYLVKKFGYDKRKAHLSSLIVSGLISRAEAEKQLAEPAWDESTIEMDKEYISKKLGFSLEELNELCDAPPRSHTDYKTGFLMLRVYYKLHRVLCRTFKRGVFFKI